MTDARALPPPAAESRLAAVRRWWGDHALAQAVGLAAVTVVLAVLTANVVASMRRLGMSPNFDYLAQPANFDISESLIVYRAGDPYARAILVGLLNTLKLAVCGCALATVLGVTLGLLRAAGNPLLARLVATYVEVVRNTPLVLQLFFWIALTRMAPPVRQALEPLPFAYLSVRGVYLPWITVEGGAIWPVAAFLLLVALLVHEIHKRLGRPLSATEWLVAAAAAILVPAGWVWADGVRLSADLPTLRGFNIVGGISLTPEFAAMLVGLAVYYAANIAEIVRSGLQSVTRGQWEAGRALGLHRARILQLVVLPQAMRVITPLMTSTWLDLTKDTTLGVLIGFTEVTAVIKTSANNTGNAVETILVLVVVFLSISLPVSAAINAYNRMLARRGVVTS
ncbi:amino acid ABC transporter membrane protein 1 (PAAT family) [Roseiarcus fermentans]|uniref:Amino acid ABC transporter membrane protein 1 (PAAT family) n=1 Tax=Roseiarcus fermentans TaxID=1473586 RepID=A0A366FSC9_9HYPH|nr:ABC transporter permease subunit [Roseiarcus fermentans]RBP17594.1 amino acid ABC transporter membrane protein 1 (PAAT family) [Roseiarcus fermentans]